MKYPDIKIFRAPTDRGWAEARKAANIENKGVHCTETETSIILYLDEAIVKGSGIDFYPGDKDRVLDSQWLWYARMKKVSEYGGWGKPSLASKEKGKVFFECLVKETVKDIKDAFQKLDSF